MPPASNRPSMHMLSQLSCESCLFNNQEVAQFMDWAGLNCMKSGMTLPTTNTISTALTSSKMAIWPALRPKTSYCWRQSSVMPSAQIFPFPLPRLTCAVEQTSPVHDHHPPFRRGCAATARSMTCPNLGSPSPKPWLNYAFLKNGCSILR